MNDHKLLVCAVASIVAHFALARGLQQLPRHVDQPLPQKIEIRVLQPEPEPEPPKPPEPKPPEPKPDVHERPQTRPVNAPLVEALPKDSPAPINRSSNWRRRDRI